MHVLSERVLTVTAVLGGLEPSLLLEYTVMTYCLYASSPVMSVP